MKLVSVLNRTKSVSNLIVICVCIVTRPQLDSKISKTKFHRYINQQPPLIRVTFYLNVPQESQTAANPFKDPVAP